MFLRMHTGESESGAFDESEEQEVEALVTRYKASNADVDASCLGTADCKCYPVHVRTDGKGTWIAFARLPGANRE